MFGRAGTDRVILPGITYVNSIQIHDVNAHPVSGGAAPTIAAGTGAGTSPTIAISGTDNFQTITLTTGSTPSATATICTVTFNKTWGSAPKCIISPGNGTAALANNGTTNPYVSAMTTTTFTFTSTGALAASTQYIWNCACGY